MALVRNLTTYDSTPNQVALSWTQPLGFNTANSQIVISKSSSYFPMELFNANFPTKNTDQTSVQIFSGQTIAQTNPAGVTVSTNQLVDSAASFGVLRGRILRDSNGNTFKILSNTSNTLYLDGTPAGGKYVILADFPSTITAQQKFENNINTVATNGTISNLVQVINNIPTVITFEPDALANLIFFDGSNKYIIQGNDTTTITFFNGETPTVGNGMAILSSSTNNRIIQYVDNFKNKSEVTANYGSGLLDDQFYYYTAFTLPVGANVAEAEFATYDSPQSTQSVGLSTANKDFSTILYNYWPEIFQQGDATGDLKDLMSVFGYQFQEIHSYITTYNLQDTDKVYVTALAALADQTGLPSVGYGIGIDTFRRIARDMITAWKLKGSKQGIALFIRILTTWDITNGTGDIDDAISDNLPNVSAFRFFSSALGSTNTRFTQTNTVQIPDGNGQTTVYVGSVPASAVGTPNVNFITSSPAVLGGKFPKTLPGIIIPGFFTFREFVITLPNVALFLGLSYSFSVSNGTTTMTDNYANYGATDSLVGNYLLPNQQEPNALYQIISNTSNSVTVQGILINRQIGNNYAILSPLNASRFKILTKFMPLYSPYGTQASFNFT